MSDRRVEPTRGESVAAEIPVLSAYARIQSVNDDERHNFEPSRLIERLVLQILVVGRT
jgi:hypothetical protein